MNIAIRIGTLLIALLPGMAPLGAQEWTVQGRVLDAVSGRPLRDAHVLVEGRVAGAVTDTAGRFGVPWDRRSQLSLRISHIGHATFHQVLQPREWPAGRELVVHLVRSTVSIPEVVITRQRVPEVVFQRQDLHVGDHLPSADGLWVLAYEKPRLWHAQDEAGQQVLHNARLHLLDTVFREVASWPLPGPVRRLHRDHQGRTIVEGLDKAWLVGLNEGALVLHAMDRRLLHDAILPWTDSIPGHLLGNTRIGEFPAFDHIAFDPIAGRRQTFCTVEDRHVMQLFRSQYKYMSGRDKVIAMDLEFETGIDREIIAGFMTGFPNDILFSVPYAPLFVVDDTLCVFDHSTGLIRRYTPGLLPCGEATMEHHVLRTFRGRLLQDPVDGRVYAVFARGPQMWLRAVDAGSGALGTEVRLTHPYPEELRVYDGHVYYVYRPYGSLQRRTLFREELTFARKTPAIADQP